MRFILAFCLLFIFSSSVFSMSDTELEQAIIKAFPNASIEKKEVKYHYKKQWIVMIDQFLDHENPAMGVFKQQLILSHHDANSPMLFVTEGYDARPRHYELSEILMSNQLIVEYRFFGRSKPSTLDYKYLTNQQAMKDLHRIRNAFKKIYKKEWVSTGISKGGTTCLYYKATYPRDIKVAIPYVAPLPNAREDIRTNQSIDKAGSADCRKALYNFQRNSLKKLPEILPFAQSYAQDAGITFNRVQTIEKALEYAVLEYTFSFWQMGHDCEDVPRDENPENLWNHLKEVVGIDFYSDGVVSYYEPSFYQFMTQNGYYGFSHDHLDDLLQNVTVFNNTLFAPRNVNLDYDPTYNMWINKRLDKKGKRIILIQGEYDPWGALTYAPKKKNNLLIVHPEGSHRVRIKDLSQKNQNLIYAKLDRWLRSEIHPLGPRT